MYAAHIDDKGRLKMPKDFQDFFMEVGEKKFFVTSLDRAIGSIYTLPLWRHNLRVFAESESTEDGPAAEEIGFLADELGGQVEMDSQGRLLVPAELRKALGMENQAVRLRAVGDRIDILCDKVYAKHQARTEDPEANALKLARLKKRGVK
jgi:MraZ protein